MRRVSHLRIFAVSLVLVAVALIAMLFGVQLEAVAPATGIITARDLQEVRTVIAGLAEPGWYEGFVTSEDGQRIAVRLDGNGNGHTDPSADGSHHVLHHEWTGKQQRLPVEDISFHRLQSGDVLWPGQVLASIRADDVRMHLGKLEDQLREMESRGEHSLTLRRERDRLRERLDQAVLHVPTTARRWLVVEVHVSPQQAVQPGDVFATIVPIDPETRQPLDLMARLDVDERYGADLQPGQEVRLRSRVYNHRIFGSVAARVERLDPAADNQHHLHADALIPAPPFRLPLGSSVEAEIVVGRKPVYRIILEH